MYAENGCTFTSLQWNNFSLSFQHVTRLGSIRRRRFGSVSPSKKPGSRRYSVTNHSGARPTLSEHRPSWPVGQREPRWISYGPSSCPQQAPTGRTTRRKRRRNINSPRIWVLCLFGRTSGGKICASNFWKGRVRRSLCQHRANPKVVCENGRATLDQRD